jgi:CheY-like chemotaxis protein
MGIQFVDPNDQTRERIEAFIADCAGVPSLESLPPSKPLSVLVVDDDAAYVKVAVEPFERRGDRVRVAHDGIEALALCIKEAPDVILCDVQMPRMDGWQLLRVVRARPALVKVPFVFLTSLDSESDRLRGYRLGVDDFIAKPYRPQEVLARADRAVARAASSNEEVDLPTLRGDLEQVGPSSVLSFLEMERRTGVLSLSGAPAARVWLREGAPINVAIAGRPASAPVRELFFEVLDRQNGPFAFTARDIADPDRIGAPVTMLLLEHARRKDESAR